MGRQQARRHRAFARFWARTKQIFTTDPQRDESDDVCVDLADAAELQRHAADAKGALAKAAQWAAYADAGKAHQVQTQLAPLWDTAPGAARAAIEDLIRQELGAAPHAFFSEWQSTPIAAASLGQVHAARYAAQAVVVKVQYPHVAHDLRKDVQDPALLRELLGAALVDGVDRPGLAALGAALVAELDYRREAAALSAFAARWRDDAVLRFPRVFAEASTERVLTMTLAPGRKLHEAVRDPGLPAEVRDRCTAALYRFAWGGALRDGAWNADPNPGNFLIETTAPGYLWCLDFGATCELSQAERNAECELWWGLMHPDAQVAAERFRLALQQTGLLARPDALALDAHREWERVIAAPFRHSRFTWDAEYASVFAMATKRVLAAGALRMPASLVMLWRQRIAVASVLGMLGGCFNPRDELQQLIGTGRKALR